MRMLSYRQEKNTIHPVALATTDLQFDATTIAAALLRGGRYPPWKISKSFRQRNCFDCGRSNENQQIKFQTKQEEQAENFRKMLLAMAKDIRVIFIKLADRLHNMRTIKYIEEKQKKGTGNQMSPLAHRLGILNQMGVGRYFFSIFERRAYHEIVHQVAQNRAQKAYIKQFIDMLKTKLKIRKSTIALRAEPNILRYRKCRSGNFRNL